MINTPISTEELKQAKDTLKGKWIKNLEYSGAKNAMLSSSSIAEVRDLFNITDSITSTDIQNFAKINLAKPSIISISANKEVLDANKDYLADFGEIV